MRKKATLGLDWMGVPTARKGGINPSYVGAWVALPVSEEQRCVLWFAAIHDITRAPV